MLCIHNVYIRMVVLIYHYFLLLVVVPKDHIEDTSFDRLLPEAEISLNVTKIRSQDTYIHIYVV